MIFSKSNVVNVCMALSAWVGSIQAQVFKDSDSSQRIHLLDQAVINKSQFLAGNPSEGLRINTPLGLLPQNIQIITSSLFSDQQAFDMLEGIQRNVSGAQKVEHWDNYARINMRGAQIAAFRNGLNVQMPWGPLAEDLSMVERIEFVKGPAGFMLGLGEPGGFYNVVTKKPYGRERGEVTFTLGSFNTWRTSADYDGKLSKNGKWLYRLNVMGQLKGSHRDFEFNHRYSFVPVLRYIINDQSMVTFEYTHQFSEMNVIGSNYAFSRRGYGDLPLNFTTAEPNMPSTVIHDRSLMTTFNHQLNKQWKLTAQLAYFNYQQNGQSIWPRFINNRNDSFMQRGISIWDALGLNRNAQIFMNGWVQTGALTHKILGGIDMSHKDYFADWNQAATLGDTNFNIYQPEYGKVSSAKMPEWNREENIRQRGVRYTTYYQSFYVQDEISLLNQALRLTIGGRYTTATTVNPYSGNNTSDKFTPRLGINYSLNKSMTIYALYDQSFTANMGADWEGKSFDPLTGINTELGWKKEWLEGKWMSTVSAYQITKNNVLTTDLEHPNSSGQFVFNRTTGQQQVQGVEVDIKGNLLPNLSVVLNYAYTEAIITKDANEELIGNQVAGATKHIQNAWINYSVKKGFLEGFGASIGYQYQAGRSSWFIFDGTENALPDYFRLDGGISWQKEKLKLNLTVNNILNAYLYSGAPYFGIYYWQTEAGRNSRITVSYQF